METGCLFLYRKVVNRNYSDSLLAAPKMRGTDQQVAGFLNEFSLVAEALEPIDEMLAADKAAAAAAEANGEGLIEEAPSESEPLDLCTSFLCLAVLCMLLECVFFLTLRKMSDFTCQPQRCAAFGDIPSS